MRAGRTAADATRHSLEWYHPSVNRFRAAVISLVVGVVFLVTPLAYASPPDDTWIGGFWDDDDFDSVVLAITSTEVVWVAPLDQPKPVLVVLGEVSDPDDAPRCLKAVRPVPSRAPPTA